MCGWVCVSKWTATTHLLAALVWREAARLSDLLGGLANSNLGSLRSPSALRARGHHTFSEVFWSELPEPKTQHAMIMECSGPWSRKNTTIVESLVPSRKRGPHQRRFWAGPRNGHFVHKGGGEGRVQILSRTKQRDCFFETGFFFEQGFFEAGFFATRFFFCLSKS